MHNRPVLSTTKVMFAAAMLVGSIVGVMPTAQASEDSLTVMSRNIYLGADVSVALDLIPDMPAAAQFMWEQVAQTDFSQRAPVLAAELAREKPDVVAVQEATTWYCRPSLFGSSTAVFDFTAQLLEATEATGVEYVVAEHEGEKAFNPGYSIPVLPYLTTVSDPETFQPLFGTDEAACGFTIGDALLVRADLADSVTAVGSGDYESKYAVVPIVFEIDRGYTWADLALPRGAVRVVTTHLESAWDAGSAPVNADQARELVRVTESWDMPLVVIGDFNSDPRDPRPPNAPNPGLQPDTSTGCDAQVSGPSPSTADATCNSYWTMVQAGFEDVGPDALDPANATWGASALLAGPDPDRLGSGASNEFGFTDRLDYIFVKNGVSVVQTVLIGETWPQGKDMWACDSPDQVRNAELVASRMQEKLGESFCLPTDHVGLLATMDIPVTATGPGPDRTAAIVVGAAAILAMTALVTIWAVRRG